MRAHRGKLSRTVVLLPCLLATGLVHAVGMTVGPGASYSLGVGTTDLGCGDLNVAGTLHLNSGMIDQTDSVLLSGTINGNTGSITFGDDWSKSGTFSAGSSQVTLNDDCGDGASLFTGDTAFYGLTVTTTSGKQWNLTSGSTQDIANALSFTGTSGNGLVIRSTTGGSPAFIELAPGGSQLIDYVDVADNHALGPPGQWIAPGYASDYNSVDSGGNDRWFGLGIARFEVFKEYDDGNLAAVEVSISCNTGLPLDQTKTVDPWNDVTFVVRDFDVGELDCEITETGGPAGYAAYYDDGEQGANDVSCAYEDVVDQDRFTCTIVNELQPVTIAVTKVWEETHPEYNLPTEASAQWQCYNAAHSSCGPSKIECMEGNSNPSGWLSFNGSEDTETFEVLPRWDGTTYCEINEVGHESEVEVDDSDCESVGVTPGNGNECTIVNVRFFEGIPTLNEYGLALLALLMLGMGWIGFRRMS